MWVREPKISQAIRSEAPSKPTGIDNSCNIRTSRCLPKNPELCHRHDNFYSSTSISPSVPQIFPYDKARTDLSAWTVSPGWTAFEDWARNRI